MKKAMEVGHKQKTKKRKEKEKRSVGSTSHGPE
jgi:hypothetical protein